MKFVNVRGCNGSGKTTLLRMLARDPLCRVETLRVRHMVKDKTSGNKIRAYHPPIPVTYAPGGIAILGDYTPNAKGTTAGCDRIKTQEAAKNALELIAREGEAKVVLFEGVVISTIYQPWKEWSDRNGGMVWAFLDTPLEVCLRRIQDRNGGLPIKEDLVEGKHRTVARVLEKAYADGETISLIRWDHARRDIVDLVEDLTSRGEKQ